MMYHIIVDNMYQYKSTPLKTSKSFALSTFSTVYIGQKHNPQQNIIYITTLLKSTIIKTHEHCRISFIKFKIISTIYRYIGTCSNCDIKQTIFIWHYLTF